MATGAPLTLLDLARRTDPDGDAADIVELLSQANAFTNAIGANNYIVGDLVTFERRNRWWRRALIWLRLMKPDSPPKQFTVSWSNPSKPFGA